MADDKTKAGQADRIRINVHEDYEVRDWSKRLGVTEQQLRDAVRRVGPMAGDVARTFGKTL